MEPTQLHLRMHYCDLQAIKYNISTDREIMEYHSKTISEKTWSLTSHIDMGMDKGPVGSWVQEAKHLPLCYNITCNELPQYLWQGIHPNRTLQEIL